MPTMTSAQAKVSARRRRAGALLQRMLTINNIAKMPVMTASGPAGGIFGVRGDGVKKPGGRFERAGESDAVQVAAVVEVPAFGVQVTAEPSAVVPLMNWTVPVMPTPLLVELVTVALSMSVAPELIVLEAAVTAVVVGTEPVVPTVRLVLPVLEP